MRIVHLLFLLFKSYDEAAELYKLAVERWPSSKWAVEAQKRLARMYVKIGDYEKADAAAAKLIESFSNAEGVAAAIEDVADMYQMVGSQAKSYPLHRYVVEHWPEHERAIWCQMKAVLAQLRLGDLAKAEQELVDLLYGFAGQKDLSDAVQEVVDDYYKRGEHERGRQLYNQFKDIESGDEDTLLELQVGVTISSAGLGDEPAVARPSINWFRISMIIRSWPRVCCK